MADPSDDDGLGTIGLPRDAVKRLVKDAEGTKPKTAARPSAEPSPAAPRVAPPRLEGGRPERLPPGEIDLGDLATVPPVAARRAWTPPAGTGPAPDLRQRPHMPPADPRPRRDEPAPERPAIPRSPSPPAPTERALDDPEFITNLPPRSLDRAGIRPPQPPRPPVDRLDEIARPLPEETRAAPAGFLPTPPVPDSIESHSDTPVRFPSAADRARPAAADRARPAPVGRRAEPADEIDRTQGFFPGILAASTGKSILQFFNNSIGEWCFLGEVDRAGKVLGRATFQASDAGRDGLAEAHLRIGIAGDELYVEPLESLNGVYRRLQPNRRESLAPYTRFRIGRHVLEFRPAEPPPAIAPLRSEDGEVFQSRVLVPLGFLDLIGPDARPYLSFPLTRRDERGTRIGRAGVECDIALSGDEWVSQRHACLSFSDGSCWLEDLKSTNGTFLILTDRTPLRRGTARSPESGDEILVGPYKIRVIEWKA